MQTRIMKTFVASKVRSNWAALAIAYMSSCDCYQVKDFDAWKLSTSFQKRRRKGRKTKTLFFSHRRAQKQWTWTALETALATGCCMPDSIKTKDVSPAGWKMGSECSTPIRSKKKNGTTFRTLVESVNDPLNHSIFLITMTTTTVTTFVDVVECAKLVNHCDYFHLTDISISHGQISTIVAQYLFVFFLHNKSRSSGPDYVLASY